MNCRRNAPFTPKSSGVYFIKTRASSLRQGDDRTREIGSNVVAWAPPPPPPSGPRARAAFSESFRPLRAVTMSRGPTLLARRQHLLSCPTFPRCVSIGRLFLPGLSLWWQPKGDFSEFINNSALTGEVLRRQQFSRSPRVRTGFLSPVLVSPSRASHGLRGGQRSRPGRHPPSPHTAIAAKRPGFFARAAKESESSVGKA